MLWNSYSDTELIVLSLPCNICLRQNLLSSAPFNHVYQSTILYKGYSEFSELNMGVIAELRQGFGGCSLSKPCQEFPGMVSLADSQLPASTFPFQPLGASSNSLQSC